jgi:hypothetical protein
VILLAIDPGPEKSAYVLWDGKRILDFAKCDNRDLLSNIFLWNKRYNDGHPCQCVIEKIDSYGMPVGAEVFETVYWSGRFAQAFEGEHLLDMVDRIERLKVKQHLCHDSRAKDPNIRQALIDRVGPQGTKKEPGPTYGITKDVWAALAVAVTWWDQRNYREAIRG